jgi:small subunit ribosomal protein S20
MIYLATKGGGSMPNTKSAEKRLRQNRKRYMRNRAIRSMVKTYTKRVLLAKSLEEARKALFEAVRIIDKAASKGVIHKNTASRKKSRLYTFVNKMEKEAALSEA